VAVARARNSIVVGAGIGGLCAGIALRRAGIETHVFERAPELAEVGAGISLWANALRALDSLGLGDAVRGIGLTMTGGLRRPDGSMLAQPVPEALLRRYPEFCVVVHRAELQSLLVDTLGSRHVTLDAPCEAVSQDGLYASMTIAGRGTTDADIVIGADGLHSVVRQQLHGTVAPDYAGYTAWRGVAELDPREVAVGETWGKGIRFGQVPLTRGRVYWFAAANAAEGASSKDGERAELLRLFRGWHAPIESLIERTPDGRILRNDIYDRRPLTRWGAGRITLLGDAAHPMTPNLGQGACQAIEDAVVVARCLTRTIDPVAALVEYEALRRPRTEAIVRQSRRVGRIAQLANPVAVGIRDAIVRLVPARTQSAQLEPVIGYDASMA
jgi:2-polyprenyl-6-methoxyphenol hydroxylase-like FAD-dependent oxidoreductase